LRHYPSLKDDDRVQRPSGMLYSTKCQQVATFPPFGGKVLYGIDKDATMSSCPIVFILPWKHIGNKKNIFSKPLRCSMFKTFILYLLYIKYMTVRQTGSKTGAVEALPGASTT